MLTQAFTESDSRIDRALFGALLLLALGAPFSIALSQAALAAATLLGIACYLRDRCLPRTGVELFALAFVGWALLTIPFSGEPAESLRHAKRFLLLPALWLFAGAARSEARRTALLAALAVGAAGVGVFGIVQYARGPGGLIGRADLTQGYMTAGGLMMLAGLVILAFLLVARGRKARILLGAALFPVLVALAVTYTRNAWLGFAAGCVLLLALLRPRVTPIFLLMLVLGGAFAPGELRGRLLSSFDPGHVHNRQRVLMWKTGWRMLSENPLTGVGDRNLAELYQSYHEGEDVEVKGHLHSNYVMFGALWGWPGLILTLAFLFALFSRLWQRWRRLRVAIPAGERAPPTVAWTAAAMACWLAFMVGGLFEWNFGDAEIALLLWAVIGVGLAAGEAPIGAAGGEA